MFAKTFEVAVTDSTGRTFVSTLKAQSGQAALDIAVGAFYRTGRKPVSAKANQIVWGF